MKTCIDCGLTRRYLFKTWGTLGRGQVYTDLAKRAQLNRNCIPWKNKLSDTH